MILADENVHGAVIRMLRAAGYDVTSISEIAGGANDEKVIELALQYNYLLLTEDKDFGEWVFAHHIKDLSVIFLRYVSSEYIEIAEAMVTLLQTQKLERPFFATVTTKKVRVRKL